MKEKITFVAGLYYYIRNGHSIFPNKIVSELKQSVILNPWYKENLVCYADSRQMANILISEGVYVHKIFDDAPSSIIYDAAHKMKHWIMFNAVKEFHDVVWIDWDTYLLKPIDKNFIEYCFKTLNPKFTYIKNYWATVNCSIYYLNESYIETMERSFYSKVSEPNDELLWKSVLPENIISLKEFWLEDMVINIWDNQDFQLITDKTYFLHLKNFEMLKILRL